MILKFSASPRPLLVKIFFKGKIIEVSLRGNYLKEVEDLDAVKENYTKINIEKMLHLNLPIKVYTQGIEIETFTIMDTGNPGYLILNYRIGENYGVNLENTVASNIRFSNNAKSSEQCMVPMDSIRFNDNYIVKGNYKMLFLKYPNEEAMMGTLGNGFWEEFVFILDQKNYDLYLKPINK